MNLRIMLTKNLGNLYSATYHSPIDTTDLFQTSIVYGNSCGIAGTSKEYQERLSSLIQRRDLSTLSSWLWSPNIEKQLYAIKGLKTMEKFGYQLTAKDSRIIKLISQKNGLINICSGCIHSADSIKNVLAQIEPYLFRAKTKTSDFSIVWQLYH